MPLKREKGGYIVFYGQKPKILKTDPDKKGPNNSNALFKNLKKVELTEKLDEKLQCFQL